jgi:hypothetical protein
MNHVLVSIEGTICDLQHRSTLRGTPQFYAHSEILKDQTVEGSVSCLQSIAGDYDIVYLGKRPPNTQSSTEEWLEKWDFPSGPVHCSEHHAERLSQVHHMISNCNFIAGIGSGWEDNQYHRICACLSIILSGDEKSWSAIPTSIREYERTEKIKENQLVLQGKIQGLSQILPLLHSYYGDELWERYHQALKKTMEDSRERRKEEDLQSLSEQGFDASDLRDIVQWYTLYNENMHENPNFGLQDWEIVEARKSRCEIKVTRCRYAELWKEHNRPDIGYQTHCRPDEIWLDRPAWNSCVRFEHPKTLMQGDDHCLFIHFLEE